MEKESLQQQDGRMPEFGMSSKDRNKKNWQDIRASFIHGLFRQSNCKVDLIDKGILQQTQQGGRSTSYELK